MKVRKTEIAWAAGFYDGEGSTKIGYDHYKTKKGKKRSPNKKITVTVSQCDLEPLVRFKKAVGDVGSICGPYQYSAQKRPYWIYSASYAMAEKVYKIISPYLSSIKKKQYKIVTSEVSSHKLRKKGWIHDKK